MNVYEMEGFLRGKCLPGDLKVNESIAEYLVRKLNAVSEFKVKLTAALATIETCREIVGCPAGVDLQDWVKQLAAENVALSAVFSQKEIPSEAVDAFMETAVMDHDWNETSEWSWVENETEVIHAVLEALKPETPATDRIVAEAEARGVDKFAKKLESRGRHQDYVEIANAFAKQLREGDK
ncbi:TPA: hypothetical protein ACHOYU_004181 [Raoultella planticola]|uniref:hypothetical protein n=1 Tax=Raoultella ornithinolytica TaxID=54291 RepID=UPI002FF01E57